MENQQSNPPTGGQQIQIKASDDALKGHYANAAQVSHTSEEFVFDFMNVFPPAGVLSARVILSPSHAKRLMGAMQENLKKYEDEYGTISLAVVPDRKIGFKTE